MLDGKITQNPKRITPHPLKLIQKIFGITRSELDLLDLLYMVPDGGTCISNIVLDLGKERSTIQKQIYALKKKGLVTREKISLTEFHERCSRNSREDLIQSTDKGSLYIYKPIPPAKLLKKIEQKYSYMIEMLYNYFGIQQ